MRRTLLSLVLPLLVLALPACAPAGSLSTAAPGVQVRVSSASRSDVNVFAMRGGQRIRLGTVPAGQSRTFRVESVQPGTVSRLSLRVEAIGSEDEWQSDVISLIPGQDIHLRVEALIGSSHVRLQESA
jgi:hypothetical protein